MAGLFYNLGRKVGPKVRKAKWIWQSVAGSEEEALKMEHLVGRDLAEEVRCQLQPVTNTEKERMLNKIGSALVSCLVKQDRRFNFEIVHGDRPNAFALPGGYIFVTESIIELCTKEDEVAFILSHEMAHVVRGHAMKRIISSSAISTAARAAPIRGSIARWFKTVGISFLESAYSRETENQADALALRLSAAAGYDPRAAISLFQRIHGIKTDDNTGNAGYYFGTHPPFNERIREINYQLRRLEVKS